MLTRQTKRYGHVAAIEDYEYLFLQVQNEKAFRRIEEVVHTSFFYSNDEGRGGFGMDGKIARDFEAKDFFRFFSLGEKLGQGATGKVFKATLKCPPEGQEPTTYAVKRVRRWGLREKAKKALRQEVEILHELVHKNIIDIYQFYPKDPQYSYMVLEFMAGGELFERIVKKMSYNEMEARDMCEVLINALGYCHERGIVHRDIKPSNILLTSREDDATIKLADFGYACNVSKKKVITKCGTPDFMAPEILLGKPHDTVSAEGGRGTGGRGRWRWGGGGAMGGGCSMCVFYLTCGGARIPPPAGDKAVWTGVGCTNRSAWTFLSAL
eukprot:jgi/Undpi1/926/HiC_scaffold_10.g04390.m1